MARKFEIDTAILKDIKSVASDNFASNIQMIDVNLISPSLENFYSITEIEILAEDIERQGLKHNLVVSEDKENLGKYLLKSGHRRFEAIKLLIEENKITSKTVPCLIDGTKTKNENMLDLIMLNATTRVMSDSEIILQYEKLELTYKELEKEGKKFKGRLRERIAKALNISSAQVGKIEYINKNATKEIKDAVKSGEISIAVADEISKLSLNSQEDLIKNKPIKEITRKEVLEKKKEKTNENIKEVEREIANENIVLSSKEVVLLQKVLPQIAEELKENDPYNYSIIKDLIQKL